MKILRAYKTELKPNNKQCSQFVRYAGAARYVYNWALADRIERYKAGQSTNRYEQSKRFNALKGEQCPWISEIAYVVTQEALSNLDRAYQNFFRRVKAGKEQSGFPKFKSRKNGIGSFRVRGNVHIIDNKIKLPILGWLRLKRCGYLPLDGTVKLLSATVSEQAGHWFVSVQCETEIPERQATGPAIGLDVGIKQLGVCSNGKVFDNPKSLNKYERRMKRLQRELSRRKKGSCNRAKTKVKLARCHQKIANIRQHALHQVSSYVTAKIKPNIVVLEDLNVAGMLKNHHLARAISDASFSELHRQVGYKAAWNGIEVVKAGQFFASSKTCSRCGYINADLTLAERIYHCPTCGLEIDRDLNAARNLAALGEGRNAPGLSAELECCNALL